MKTTDLMNTMTVYWISVHDDLHKDPLDEAESARAQHSISGAAQLKSANVRMAAMD